MLPQNLMRSYHLLLKSTIALLFFIILCEVHMYADESSNDKSPVDQKTPPPPPYMFNLGGLDDEEVSALEDSFTNILKRFAEKMSGASSIGDEVHSGHERDVHQIVS